MFPRTAKPVPLSPQARDTLGTDAEALPADELVRAVLRAPVDLLFNGGIGTYVKARGEHNADVRDRANESVRVDARRAPCASRGRGRKPRPHPDAPGSSTPWPAAG